MNILSSYIDNNGSESQVASISYDYLKENFSINDFESEKHLSETAKTISYYSLPIRYVYIDKNKCCEMIYGWKS